MPVATRPDGAPDALRRTAPGARVTTCRQACRAELDRFRALAAEEGELLVGCTQEAPLFADVAAEEDLPATLRFANIRETAGWSAEGERASPKMAALLALAALPPLDVVPVTLESEGVALVLGVDDVAIAAARRLADTLDVTVLLAPGETATPPREWPFPIRRGRVAGATGHLGAFELRIDGFAEPAPSSRARFVWGPSRDGATSRADLVLDLTGGPALFPAADLRPGYLRADPRVPAQVEALIGKAADLVGTFDKPRYVNYDPSICAHSRNRRVGCSRCLSVCPTGAIAPNGDAVAIDAAVCAGCGSCAVVCPTGAASYALPAHADLLTRLRVVLRAYREASAPGAGRDAVILFHDGAHGADLVDALARFGPGLPARVIPFPVNEATQVGLDAIAAAAAFGAAGVRVLLRARPAHDPAALEGMVALAEIALGSQGHPPGFAAVVATDDPDALAEALASAPVAGAAAPSSFAPVGGKRAVTTLALREAHRAAPAPAPLVALPAGAPFGRLDVNVAGCTLCLACVSVCPTGALGDNPDRPRLTFDEAACVQCGLCAATCPEKVIALEPRLNFEAFGAPPVLVKEEEPYPCVSCGKPFGVRSTVERVLAKLEGKHWMYAGGNASRLDLIRMCDDCRVQAAANDALDPYAGTAPARPRARTTEDYLREREAAGRDPLDG